MKKPDGSLSASRKSINPTHEYHPASPLPHQMSCPRNPQHKIDHDRPGKHHRQHRRTEPIVKAPLASEPYAPRPPMERDKRIDHAPHRHECEQAGADARRGVGAKVEQTDGEAAEDDGEVEPGEKGALVGEEDFGLDARGQGDAFTRRRLEEGLG